MPDFNINIKKMNPRAVIPAQGTQGAAGYDLCLYSSVLGEEGCVKRILDVLPHML